MYSIHSHVIKYSNNEYVNKMSDAKPFFKYKTQMSDYTNDMLKFNNLICRKSLSVLRIVLLH